MLSVQLEVDKRLKKGLKIPKNIPMTEINQFLAQLDKKAEEQGIVRPVVLRLLNQGELLFTDDYELGKGNVRNILLLVRSTLETTFLNEDEATKRQLLTLIQESLTIENQPIEHVVAETKKQEKQVKKSKMKKEKPEKLKKAAQPVKKQRKKVTLRKKPLLVGLILLLVVSLSCFIGYAVFTSPPKEVEPVSLAEYLTNKDYDQAVENYHSEKDVRQIMRTLALRQQTDTINSIQKKYPTTIGQFYQAFYASNWTYIVENPPQKIESSEQIMLAHASIQLGRLEEAEVLNQTLKSNRITEEIQEAKIQQAVNHLRKGEIKEAEEQQKEVKSTVLAELIDEAKTYTNLIQLYKDNKDAENQQRWEKIRSNIGKEE